MLLAPLFVRSQETPERECILIVSSYNPDTRRMARFITEFEQQILALGIPCDICIETLECKGIADAAQWISQIDNLISRYEDRSLRAVVLLGQEAWASFVSLGCIPEGVMCFSCFASENGVMLPAPPDSLQTWRPRAIDYRVMCDSLNRVGGMLNRYDIRRNIDLIRSLYPQVENIALVTDNTYGGISLQALVRAEWENYPDLNLVLVDSREGEETAFRTYATLPPRSAVMLGTWRVGSDGEFFMQRSLNDLVQNNPRVPVFSVTGTGIGDTAIGGYVPEYENGAEVIANQIRKYYDTDDIEDAHFHTSKSLYLFDSRKLKEWKIAEYALPKGSVIEDTMAAKLSKYSHYIELLVAGILLLVLLLLWGRSDAFTLSIMGGNGLSINLYTILFIAFFGIGYGAYYATADMPIPMVADCSDYETYRSGNYIPGIMGTLFSLVDKLVSSLSATVVGIAVSFIGLESLPTQYDSYTPGMNWVVIVLFCIIPMVAWAATLIAMKGYTLTGAKMKEIQAVNACRRDAVANGMKLEEAMTKWQSMDQLPAEYRS